MRRAAVAAVLATTCAGCFQSDAPLGAPGGAALDAKLLGEWRCRPPEPEDQEEEATLVVRRRGDEEYDADWREGAKVDRYRGHPSVVSGRTLLNVREAGEDGPRGQWMFVRYDLPGPDRLELLVVDEGAVGRKEAAEGLGVIRARAGDESLYRRAASCTRIRASR